MVKGRPLDRRTVETLDLLREAKALERQAEARLRELGVEVPVSRRGGRAKGGQANSALDVSGRLEAACRAAGDRAAEPARLLREVAELRWRAILVSRTLCLKFASMLRIDRHDPAEVLQEAWLGMFAAARRFDPERGIAFSTYARWWVRAYVLREMEPVDLPSGALEQLRNARKAEREGAVGDAEVAARTGISVERLHLIRNAAKPHESLDAPIGDDVTLHDVLTGEEAEESDPRDLARTAVALAALGDRQRRILELRYGLTDGVERTLCEVGRKMGVSRERIRQLERDAFAELRDAMEAPEPAPRPRVVRRRSRPTRAR